MSRLTHTAGKSDLAAHDELAVDQRSQTAIANARRNFNYLLNPSQASTGERPARLRTRALLRTVRYIGQFIIWRLVRWAKYAAVGALVAAVSASAIGGFVTGAAWVVAPPSLGASIIAASVWGAGKFAATRIRRKWHRTGTDRPNAHYRSEAGSDDSKGSVSSPTARMEAQTVSR